MSFELARFDLVQAAEAARAAWVGPPSPLVVSYENQKNLDIDRQTEVYLCVDILYVDGQQLSIGKTKALADYGQVHLVAHTKKDAGSLKAQALLSHFRNFFELKNFAVARTHASRQGGSYPVPGWVCTPLIVPFWFHRLATTP